MLHCFSFLQPPCCINNSVHMDKLTLMRLMNINFLIIESLVLTQKYSLASWLIRNINSECTCVYCSKNRTSEFRLLISYITKVYCTLLHRHSRGTLNSLCPKQSSSSCTSTRLRPFWFHFWRKVYLSSHIFRPKP